MAVALPSEGTAFLWGGSEVLAEIGGGSVPGVLGGPVGRPLGLEQEPFGGGACRKKPGLGRGVDFVLYSSKGRTRRVLSKTVPCPD